MAAAGLASTAAAAYVPYSNGSAAVAAANFLNSPAGKLWREGAIGKNNWFP
jgi:hypothetical protein